MQQDSRQLTDEILALANQNKLSCAAAQQLAKRAGVAPIAVGKAAQALGIKITDCQLGCFKHSKEK